MPDTLNKYHSSAFFRGDIFPIGKIGAPVKIADGLEEIFSSLLIIFNTKIGERIMYPGFGSNLKGLLWEPNDIIFRQRVLYELRKAITVWEPRCRLISAIYDPNPTLINLGILILSLELQVRNIPTGTTTILLPLSSQGSFLAS